MKKITKKEKAILMDYASMLPTTYQEVDVYRVMKGTHIGRGKGYYGEKRASQVPVNHFKRLCRIYRTAGMDGIKEYVQRLVDLQESHIESAGGIQLQSY